MAITRERKEQLVAEYKELAARSRGMILASFSGMTVRDIEGLRGRIREMGGEFHIVKNRLARLAFEEVGLSLPDDTFIGTTAVGFALEDVPAVTKAIVDLTKEAEGLRVKSGVIDGKIYAADQVQRLADLPPLPVVHAQLLGVLQAPAARLAGVLAGSVRQIVNVVNAYAETEAGA